MSSRTTRLLLMVLAVVALLFSGRWLAGYFAERWWAEQISPVAGEFVSAWALLTLVLETTGIIFACTWFVIHLLVVYRAIGSVQVHRRLGNLEIREAVNMGSLVWFSVVTGLLLGLVLGQGMGAEAPTFIMGWSGLHYGGTEPLLGRDLGFYVTRLPLWRFVCGFLLQVTVTALLGATILYAVIGALRWVDRRPAINDHARRHLGGLAVLTALLLAWSYLLEPYELVAGVAGNLHAGLFHFRTTVSYALAGTSLGAALISAWWAIRGRHSILLTIWALLGAGSILGHYVIPALIAADSAFTIEPQERRQFDRLAYGMTALRDSVLLRPERNPDPPLPAAIWNATLAVDATVADSGSVVAADRALVPLPRRSRPAWVVVRDQGPRGAAVSVLLDDQVRPDGHPIVLLDSDSLRGAALRLPTRAIWPRGDVTVVDSMPGGVMIGSGLRRLALAWSLQSGALLGPASETARVFWHLDPVDRLHTLAPFAVWGAPVPRFVGTDLVWLVDGYLPSETFPGSTRIRWRGRDVGSLRAAFLGVVRAQGGETSLYLRHTADDLARQWQLVTDSLIQPASAIPAEVVRAMAYPAELMETQVRVLGQPHWGLGQLIGRMGPVGRTGPEDDALWERDTSGLRIVVPYERPESRLISAVVRGVVRDGWETIDLFRVDSLLTLPDPASLAARWQRFPTFQQLKDSVERDGNRLDAGPIRYWPGVAGLGAYQPVFARQEGKEPVLVWISLAVGDRRGAGHDMEEAWQNMLGVSAPIIDAGERGSQLMEARRFLDAAEAALSRGDLEAFGRAFEALKRTIRSP